MEKTTFLKITLLFIVIVIGCDKGDDPVDIHEGIYQEDFDFISDKVKKYYPFLEYKKINWDSIYEVYLPLVDSATTKNEIKTIFVNLLAELKDGHANVYDDTGYPIYAYKIRRKEKDKNSFDLELVKQYFNKEIKRFDSLYFYEILPDNIGYIYYKYFTGKEEEYTQFDSILSYLKETKGLIFDIRHNGGGNNASTYYMIKRMISSPLAGVQWSKKGGGLYPAEIHYPEGDYQYTKPTALLINGVCYSAADGFANLCKKIPHVTLIGDTTGGGSGVPEIYTLEVSKLIIRIPERCEMRYDGEHVEWNGIPPDIRVPQTEEDIENTQDKQLDYAIDYINDIK